MIAEEMRMLSWAVTFLFLALMAAVLRFGGIAETPAGLSRALFGIFLFVVSLIPDRLPLAV